MLALCVAQKQHGVYGDLHAVRQHNGCTGCLQRKSRGQCGVPVASDQG